MILRDSLYTIRQRTTDGKAVRFDIVLNAEHTIFRAHFPGEPVTPGVCILQMAKELLEEELHGCYEIQSVKNVKFLAVISPVETPMVTFTIGKMAHDESDQTVKAQLTVEGDGKPMAKISFTLKKRIDS